MIGVKKRKGMGHWGLAVGLLNCGLVFAIGLVSAYSVPQAPLQIPELRENPLQVELNYDWAQVVTDSQLDLVLEKLRPRLNHAEPKINHVDHALRMWSDKAQFHDSECLDGQQMMRMLTQANSFQAAWGQDASSLLIKSKFGIGFRTQDGDATSSHVDHTLGTLAEIGTPLSFEIGLPGDLGNEAGRSANVRDLLTAAMRDFRLNQKEYEWTTAAAASYASGPTSWISQDREIITFDLLAKRLMRQEWNEGVCYGNHRLYTLAMLLQFDEQSSLFRQPQTRQDVIEHLQNATTRLVASQYPEGFWDENWPDASRPPQESKVGGPLSRRTLATGHALEWWAIAPQEVLPPREVIVRAGQWLVREVERMEPETVLKNYTFLTHVGRALCMWRGKLPHQLPEYTSTVSMSISDSSKATNL